MQHQAAESSGNSFIDDNHEGLLRHLEKMISLVSVGWNSAAFMAEVQRFITYVESHFSHEETILKGARYQDLSVHAMRHREIALYLRMESFNNLDYDAAVQFLANVRSQIFKHELLEDQDYWHVFESEDESKAVLISWENELETGDAETDAHHQALVNYINRIHKRFATSADSESACRELRALSEYSKYHFSEEERALGTNLRAAHKINHHRLIDDLNIVINEVKAGEFELKNIGGYLRFWLLNHIQTFDVPAFKSN